jgi:hypothetical protein
MNIIKKINILKKKKFKKFKKLINLDKFDNIEFIGDKIKFISKNNKVLFKFNFYGILKNDIFIWANIIPGVSIEVINKVKEMKDSSRLFKDTKNKQVLFYYQLLNENMIYLTDDKQKEWINDLLLYLDDSLWSLNTINTKGNFQFMTLTDIISYK